MEAMIVPGKSYFTSGSLTHELIPLEVYSPIDQVRVNSEALDVKSVRALIAQASGQPFGKSRLIIVENAELLSEAVQNTFLKLLEEPPPYLAIVLIGSRIDSLLPTVRSRLHRLNLGSGPKTSPDLDSLKILAEDSKLEAVISATKDRQGLVALLEGVLRVSSAAIVESPSLELSQRIILLDSSIRRLKQNVNQKLVADALLLNWSVK